jgi:hypothetical protein|tara:strand:+ start:21320 stop:21517 length:198 start_codon:yes stop_codon:yes gene_type:complete
MVKNNTQRRISDYLLRLDKLRGDFDAYRTRKRKDGRYDILGFDVAFDAFGEIRTNETLLGVKDFS